MADTLKIRRIRIPISFGVPVEVLAPEYLQAADKPLAIRMSNDEGHIEIWAWDKEGMPLVSTKFIVVMDNTPHTFDKDGPRFRRHFGTVFSGGYAYHLLSLIETYVEQEREVK